MDLSVPFHDSLCHLTSYIWPTHEQAYLPIKSCRTIAVTIHSPYIYADSTHIQSTFNTYSTVLR